ncbi:MAG: pyridoxal phosphate-dependent aminotransferase [Pseudomonadota bacterium]
MDIQLSNRVKQVKPSPTLAVSAKAAELKAEGKDIIGLGTGEPDFDTPDFIKAAGIAAIEAGKTKYTAVDGTAELKQAIIEKFKRDNGLTFNHNNILVSSGGKQSFYNLAQAMLNPGDEVIIPAPYWVSYPDMVLLADGKPVIVESSWETQLKITPEQLEQAINDKTRLFVLNSPSNPSGKAYTLNELKALGEVLLKYPQVFVATDDMYEHILWSDEGFNNILNACPELTERTIVLNGVSKAYAMTGWRIGYAGGPAPLIAAMKKIQSQSTSNPCSIAQAAAAEAISGDQSCITPMLEAFKQRHDYVVKRLNSITGIKCLNSDGTFYAFPNCEAMIRQANMKTDVEFAAHLIDSVGLALVPGSAFGSPGYFRLSYAASLPTLEDALDRLEKAASAT